MADRIGGAPRVVAFLLFAGFVVMALALRDLPENFKTVQIAAQAPAASSASADRGAEAIGALMQKAAQEPKNQDVLIRLAEALIGSKNWQAAETFVSRAIVLDANNPHPYHLLSQILENLGRPQEAADAMKKSQAIVTSSKPAAAPPTEKGAQPPMPPELARKIAEAEKATLLNPKDANRWTELGNLYFDTNQTKQAIAAYEQSLALVPGNPDVLTDLGIMYRESGAYEKAVECFRKASAIDAGHVNAQFNEGVVLLYDLGRKEDAVRVWKQLLRVKPDARASNGQAVSEILKQVR
ncbi:MAG: tetratricopeptide repeat protein [Desulfovibrio sp.]|jgi:tetratricopeptide (TPR) repeat protein|nr:tetratricopeptide repeat protein [Desulfovibrio sp.]